MLDDVADGLAQDARGLHVGARRQRLRQLVGRRVQSASMPACARRDTTSARQSPSASISCTGLPVRPRTDRRISSSASRASVEMRSDSLVCTMVSSLAPRSSCRSAAMRLRSRSVTCSTRSSASCVKLRSISAVASRTRASRCSLALFGRLQRAALLLQQAQARPAPSSPAWQCCASCASSGRDAELLRRVLHGQRQRGHAQQQRHRPERAALRAALRAQVERGRGQRLQRQQHVPDAGHRVQPLRPGQHQASAASAAHCSGSADVDPAVAPLRIAQQELHAGQRQQRQHRRTAGTRRRALSKRHVAQPQPRVDDAPSRPTARRSRPGGCRAGSIQPSTNMKPPISSSVALSACGTRDVQRVLARMLRRQRAMRPDLAAPTGRRRAGATPPAPARGRPPSGRACSGPGRSAPAGRLTSCGWLQLRVIGSLMRPPLCTSWPFR